ncbi:MAG: prepilin-type N-terminal cleavage/methylation domain-containing protein [Coprococcus catus]|nr:prepilin-type N-terminal cleavage/methylation domain-containing protein [Coprococcus catus]
MLKFLKDKKKDNKGFTLVELVIVVAILAILVGILAPQYTKYVEKSRKAADASNLENLVTAFKTAASDGDDQVEAGTYTFTITATGTTLTSGTIEYTENTELGKVITSYAGADWTKNTKLKSKKWLTTDANGEETKTVATAISAEMTVANDGSVTVKYTPATVKNQANK